MRTIGQDELLAMLADELDAARTQIERLGIALCSDPGLARARLTELQSLDHVGQRCASVAAILRSGDLHAASHDTGLESISVRLAELRGPRVAPQL